MEFSWHRITDLSLQNKTLDEVCEMWVPDAPNQRYRRNHCWRTEMFYFCNSQTPEWTAVPRTPLTASGHICKQAVCVLSPSKIFFNSFLSKSLRMVWVWRDLCFHHPMTGIPPLDQAAQTRSNLSLNTSRVRASITSVGNLIQWLLYSI